MTIVDNGDKIAFKNALGHDLAWGFLSADCADEASPEEQAEFHKDFEIVKWEDNDYFHTDGGLYQGTDLMRVIRRKADGKLFGFQYWAGGGKYGEDFIEPNGDEEGFEAKYDEEWNTIEEWYVFLPIVEKPLPAYVFEDD